MNHESPQGPESSSCSGSCSAEKKAACSAAKKSPNEDSITCFCYRLTTGMLKEAYKKYGSLAEVERVTRAGTGCTGCKIVLQSLFNEVPSDQYNLDKQPVIGSACAKPGQRTMRGLFIADGNLESTIYSANCVAPQLGDCEAGTEIEYKILDHKGSLVLERKAFLGTNKTFVFEGAKEELPRPLYGTFLLTLGRSNFGAARFNICWSNGRGSCSTHENSITGRPRVFLPLLVDKRLIEGSNDIYIAVMNPHASTKSYTLTVFDPETKESVEWHSELPAGCTTWINASQHLYGPAIATYPNGRFALRVASDVLDNTACLTVYFFFHNRVTDLWSVNHL